MYNMYIDDERTPSTSMEFIVVRSVQEAKEYIKENGLPRFISFDHDLGDGTPTGYDFAKFLVDSLLDQCTDVYVPEMFGYNVHSANPPGAENIKKLLSNLEEHLCREKTRI